MQRVYCDFIVRTSVHVVDWGGNLNCATYIVQYPSRPVTQEFFQPKSTPPGQFWLPKMAPLGHLWFLKNDPPLPTVVLARPNLATKTCLGTIFGSQKWSTGQIAMNGLTSLFSVFDKSFYCPVFDCSLFFYSNNVVFGFPTSCHHTVSP